MAIPTLEELTTFSNQPLDSEKVGGNNPYITLDDIYQKQIPDNYNISQGFFRHPALYCIYCYTNNISKG